MKTLFLAAIAVAGLPFSVVAQAQQQSPQSQQNQLVVTGHPEDIRDWQMTVSRQLDDKLIVPSMVADRLWTTGIAQVVFWAGPDGRVASPTLIRRSGSMTFDSLAVSAVKRLRNLPPLPAGLDSNQRFRADIVFAQTDGDYRRAMKQLARENALRQMASREPDTELALNVGVIPDRR